MLMKKLLVIVDKDDKLEFSFNAKAMNVILSGLDESKFVKLMHYKTAQEMWEKLRNIHEGDGKLKMTKLQI